ncbi:MAG TPA: 3-mercaptopyruvate sulfurtransferase [Gemmatimonadales bacterium]|nr:3-mercaptopyruvate sulfurtransferase [Gemmatimonadales bacterium]
MTNRLPTPLVSTDWLAAHLGEPDLVVLDASWYLPQQQRDPRQEFQTGHIPGARWFDLDAASDPDTDLPHMLPPPAHFQATMEALGVGSSSPVVVYDGSGTQLSAPRLWWMLRAYGHEQVAVLDGGMQTWREAGHPMEAGPATAPDAVLFVPRLRPELVRSQQDVARVVESGEATMVDARSRERFGGLVDEPRAGLRRGHMPGACNLPFTELVDPATGRYLPPEALRQRLVDEGVAATDQHVITTCGSGVTASSLALAIQLAFGREVPVYDGSWAEWGRE